VTSASSFPNNNPNNNTGIYKRLLSCIKAFKLEEAVKISRQYDVTPAVSDMDQMIDSFASKREPKNTKSPSPSINQKIKFLKKIRDYGCDPQKIIDKTILPKGYNGKILMVAMMGGVIDKYVCLRSGDLWHREILRNTENEIRAIGFLKTDVFEIGGAHVRFEENNKIAIFGTSDDFGSCDKGYASKLIQQVYKNRDVVIIT